MEPGRQEERGTTFAPRHSKRRLFDVDAIRRDHPIDEMAAGAGIRLRRTGERLVGLCPFHPDRDPSLVIYPETSSYFCFGCEAGGDVIDFVGRLRGTAFRETAALLAGSTASGPPDDRSGDTRLGGSRPAGAQLGRRPATGVTAEIGSPAETGPPPAVGPEQKRVVEAAAWLYHRQCQASRQALAYLATRGVDRATAEALRVGFAAGGLARHLRELGLSLEVAGELGLLRSGRDRLAGRLVVADLDRAGRAGWLTARAVGGQEPRYLNLRLPRPLLGLGRLAGGARKASAVLVTEGPLDWLTACCWRLPAVALLGTHCSREALATLRGFRRVYLALDADEAGRQAALRVANELGAGAVVVPLPDGAADLNELGCHPDGRAAFLQALHTAERERKQG